MKKTQVYISVYRSHSEIDPQKSFVYFCKEGDLSATYRFHHNKFVKGR